MIECSPQEIIAESLISCLRTSEMSHFYACKSVKKPTILSYSDRLTQKISLKKSQSQRKLSTHYEISSDPFPTHKGKPPNSGHFLASMPPTEGPALEKVMLQGPLGIKKQQNFRYFGQTPRLDVGQALYPQANIHQPYQAQISNSGGKKISSTETYYSISSAESDRMEKEKKTLTGSSSSRKMSNHGNSASKIAEKNSLPQKLSLNSFNPKLTESETDEHLNISDQYSEVLSSYFPNRAAVTLQVGSKTNFF